MKVQEIMTQNASYLPSATTIQEAARKMRELDCGFPPIGNENDKQLVRAAKGIWG
tara:strand:- start:23006 stop:23170 length:165 start_codon:yes stop_codon:yes gene_type:complete